MIKSAKAIGIGVIGVGIMGKGHVLYLSDYVKSAKVVAIYDTNLATTNNVAKEVLKKTKVMPRVYQDIDQLLSDKSVNSVIIAYPDHLHAKYLSQSVLAGKNVLCEKPLASTVKEARKVAKIVRESKSIVGVGFMRRFDKAYQELKKQISTGKYGEVLQIRCTSRNVSSPNATTSMLLTNVAVHEIDKIRWLLGEEIVSVKVNNSKRTRKANSNLSDLISVNCKSESGKIVFSEKSIGGKPEQTLEAFNIAKKNKTFTGVEFKPSFAGALAVVSVQSALIKSWESRGWEKV